MVDSIFHPQKEISFVQSYENFVCHQGIEAEHVAKSFDKILISHEMRAAEDFNNNEIYKKLLNQVDFGLSQYLDFGRFAT